MKIGVSLRNLELLNLGGKKSKNLALSGYFSEAKTEECDQNN